MESLGVEVVPHMPAGSDGRRTTARAKGKVERPFRTVKEAHETLYHFHRPESEAEANRWLQRFVDSYNARDHRREPHSRADDWLANLPSDGVRAMCRWERFCAFAREPERRSVGLDCRLTVAGVAYEVDPELAGETVVVWWGLFDQELFVERPFVDPDPFRTLTFANVIAAKLAIADTLRLPLAKLESRRPDLHQRPGASHARSGKGHGGHPRALPARTGSWAQGPAGVSRC